MKRYNVCTLCGCELIDNAMPSPVGNVCERCLIITNKDYEKDGK